MLLTTLLALASSTSKPHVAQYEKLSRQYFKTWNSHDLVALRALFAADVTLRDWDLQASGASAVTKANGDIFEALPKIAIDVKKIHVSERSTVSYWLSSVGQYDNITTTTTTSVCEIVVHLHNAKDEVWLVVDVIEFDAAGKIRAVRAYKG